MATNLAIDPELLEEALRVSGKKTKKDTVTQALEEFIAHRRQRDILKLFRSLEWTPKFDYKRARSRR